MPSTRVIRFEREPGKEGSATVSLKGRCGSAVKRQIVVVGRVFMGCGRRIFPGLRRFWSTMCFFVVSTSQIGSMVRLASSELSFWSARRFLVVLEVSLRLASDFICLRSAAEALSVLSLVSFMFQSIQRRTYLGFL